MSYDDWDYYKGFKALEKTLAETEARERELNQRLAQLEAERAALVTVLEQEKESRRLREDEITEFEERYKLRWMERDAACRARDALVTALAESQLILEALNLSVKWELASEIKTEIARMVEVNRAALAAVRGDPARAQNQ